MQEVPEDWRIVKVTSVFKEDKNNPGNYRPVSLTYLSRKVVEQLVPDAISKQLKEKNVISSDHA